LESRRRNSRGDYRPDPNAERFPAWQHPNAEAPRERAGGDASKTSLTALVEDWWTEAKRAGRKQSTYESYRNTVAKLVAFLKHDTARRVTPEDIVRFK